MLASRSVTVVNVFFCTFICIGLSLRPARLPDLEPLDWSVGFFFFFFFFKKKKKKNKSNLARLVPSDLRLSTS